ncbi:hypothetical protein [Arenimonas sp.]|uniref:phage tail fiber protein n=1 Tax=Arenimonas sp. TaxID=1872635 RepID=UPI0025B94F7B|nr:hypothetical protein [Arenimonas sp.]
MKLLSPLRHARLVVGLALSLALAAPLAVAQQRGMTDYGEAQVIQHTFRTGAITKPSVMAVALIRATRGTWTASTAYASNDTAIPTSWAQRYYRQTVASCTSGGSEPTWPTTAGGTVADGTCSWTEQTVQLEAGTFTEVANSGGYARATLNPLDANWTAPSAGAGAGTGQTGNASAINYTPSANWTGTVVGFVLIDNATIGSGNAWFYAMLTLPKVVNNGDAVSFGIGALTVQVDG